MEQLIIQPGDPSIPEARRLIAELDTYLNSLYPTERNHLLSVEALQQPNVTFLIARIDDQVAGCGQYGNIDCRKNRPGNRETCTWMKLKIC
jgi:putative acetyltransferase